MIFVPIWLAADNLLLAIIKGGDERFRSGAATRERPMVTAQRSYLPRDVRLNKLSVRAKQSCTWIPLGHTTGDPAA